MCFRYDQNMLLFSSLRPSDAYMRQVMPCPLAGTKSVSNAEPFGTNFSGISIEIDTFFRHLNTFKNAVGEMATNLSRRQCVKYLSLVENEHLSFRAVTLHFVCSEVLWYEVGDKFCLYSVFKSYVNYRKIYNIKSTKLKCFSGCSCLCAIYWSRVLSGEWRCSWSSVDRRCSNYIWVTNNLIAY